MAIKRYSVVEEKEILSISSNSDDLPALNRRLELFNRFNKIYGERGIDPQSQDNFKDPKCYDFGNGALVYMHQFPIWGEILIHGDDAPISSALSELEKTLEIKLEEKLKS